MSIKSVSDIFAKFGEKPAAQARVIADRLGAEFQAVRMWPLRGRVPDEWKLPFVDMCQTNGLKGVTLQLLTEISAARALPAKRKRKAA